MELVWILIDMDASCAIGADAGQSSRARERAFPHFFINRSLSVSLQFTPSDIASWTSLCRRSAYFPPEMARQELDRATDEELQGRDRVKASVQFEMWYFGALLYQVTLTPTMR